MRDEMMLFKVRSLQGSEGTQGWHNTIIDGSSLQPSILSERPVRRPEASFLAVDRASTPYRLWTYTNTHYPSFSEPNVRRGAIARLQCRSAWGIIIGIQAFIFS